ncbi:MAG: hypothetical protein LBB37_01580 [Endomicrobium sp.]|jgi:hypothetical protein|nr:hypothetical protein [Endomicrobium sp.]
MQQYLNLGEKSGIEVYEISGTYISIKFKRSSKIYIYRYNRAGRDNVEIMKILARKGQGLNSYIMKNVKDLHDI